MYEFIQKCCLAGKGVEEDYKREWDAVRYLIGGKMFALVGNYKVFRGKLWVSELHLECVPELQVNCQDCPNCCDQQEFLFFVYWLKLYFSRCNQQN